MSKILEKSNANMENVKFFVYKTDDVWIRDTGPLFAYDENKNLVVLNFGFNGWGGKVPYKRDKNLKNFIGKLLNLEVINLKDIVLEGGAVELGDDGTCLLTKSAILNKNRNPDLSVEELKFYLNKYLGASKFVILEGVEGIDITDFHIDGFAKVYKDKIITMKREDLIEWGLSESDIEILYSAKNSNGKRFDFVFLPLTKNNVTLKNGKNLRYKGSYVNFYIANKVVLVPVYNDPNDSVALKILENIFPKRKVVGIDVRELYKYGGMIHCVTIQQPKMVEYN